MKQAQEGPEVASPAAWWSVVQVATVVGFAIMGDSLLYGILPLAAEDLLFSPQQVGLLLSANRLVRLVSNTWLSTLFARLGPRRPFVMAAGLGVLTTLIYAAGWGFGLFLLARLGWGIAWSGLRQGGYQAVWRGGHHQTGRLMGLLWGIIRTGSALSVLLGGYLFDHYGYRTTVLVVTGLTLMALPLAWRVRWPQTEAATPIGRPHVRFWEGWRALLHDSLQGQTVLIGALKLFFDAILVATAALFLADHIGVDQGFSLLGVGQMAGALLATRWLADLVVGPLVGVLSDWVGQLPLATLLMTLLLGCLTAALWFGGWVSLLAFVGVLLLSPGINVTLDAVANRVALRTAAPQQFIGVYATLADGGSALGPLLALPLVAWVGFAPLYLPVGGLLLLAIVHFWWRLRHMDWGTPSVSTTST